MQVQWLVDGWSRPTVSLVRLRMAARGTVLPDGVLSPDGEPKPPSNQHANSYTERTCDETRCVNAHHVRLVTRTVAAAAGGYKAPWVSGKDRAANAKYQEFRAAAIKAFHELEVLEKQLKIWSSLHDSAQAAEHREMRLRQQLADAARVMHVAKEARDTKYQGEPLEVRQEKSGWNQARARFNTLMREHMAALDALATACAAVIAVSRPSDEDLAAARKKEGFAGYSYQVSRVAYLKRKKN
jgi:hypothetical protein